MCRGSQFCQLAKTCRYYPGVLKNTGKKTIGLTTFCLLYLRYLNVVFYDQIYKKLTICDTKSSQTGEIWCPIDRFILSKAFCFVSQNLLSAKQNAYRFDCKCITLISIFLNNIKYRTKINSSFSNCEDLFIDILRGGSRTAAASEHLLIIVNGWKLGCRSSPRSASAITRISLLTFVI